MQKKKKKKKKKYTFGEHDATDRHVYESGANATHSPQYTTEST